VEDDSQQLALRNPTKNERPYQGVLEHVKMTIRRA